MKSWPEVAFPASPSRQISQQLRIFDTATGTKKLVDKKPLYRMYVCGITPYDATHLGHAATYLTFDLVNRFLRFSGSRVDYAQNITDIDDPLLERANRDGIDWKDLAHQQIELFRSDMTALRVIPPAHYIGAVDAIPLVIEAIKKLDIRDSIYKVDNDLYFRVSADSRFGKRSHLSTEQMISIFAERGGDPDRQGKNDPLDCLVWLSQRPNEPGWDSPFSIGRPGWHIECTAIAIEYLQPSETDQTLIDIQGGGSDLIFPHHEMCAAQAKVITGKELASHYVHAGMVGLDGEKMSKSKGNLVFVSRLISEGHDPMAIRWALMKSHYRSDRMWTQKILIDAEREYEALKNALLTGYIEIDGEMIGRIVDLIADDLDTPSVLQLLNSSVGSLKKSSDEDISQLKNTLDLVLGLQF